MISDKVQFKKIQWKIENTIMITAEHLERNKILTLNSTSGID